MWIARDKNGALHLFGGVHPWRSDEKWDGDCFMSLDRKDCPELKWEDDPIEVEMFIRPSLKTMVKACDESLGNLMQTNPDCYIFKGKDNMNAYSDGWMDCYDWLTKTMTKKIS